jgi:hypothetical protein
MVFGGDLLHKVHHGQVLSSHLATLVVYITQKTFTR